MAASQTYPERPLVEVRRGISFGYDAPTEDTSTLALTAPSGKYVDIRFSLRPAASAAGEVKKQLGKIHGYATAGLSTVTIPRNAESDCPPYDCCVHVRWEHTIDSSGGFETDGADLILLGNGDSMEYGFMEIRGTMQMFKEYWITPAGRATKSPCIVAEMDTETVTQTEAGSEGKAQGKGKVCGMAIRIGDFCQGLLQCGDDFWFERWECRGAEWTKDTRSNTPATASATGGILPCQWMTETVLEVGQTGTFDAKTWRITEIA